MSAPGVAAIMDFEYFPWGNSYFVTEKCKGAGKYDILSRRCYDNVCGAAAMARPADCFTGALVCQNGDAECLADRLITCAKLKSTGLPSTYMRFAACLDALFPSNVGLVKAKAPGCAAAAGLDFEAISRCSAGEEGDAAVIDQAKATPSHPFCPYVVVDGKELENKDELLSAVCAGFKGSPQPQECVAAVGTKFV
mmetsp:Transcript_49113/g.110515  ORF Transcript_49113/g.110515 Transcript_49113/m.110515 type:complete len:195 (+) Transcript_49113:206-790(+)